jgi:hypothetical protein
MYEIDCGGKIICGKQTINIYEMSSILQYILYFVSTDIAYNSGSGVCSRNKK